MDIQIPLGQLVRMSFPESIEENTLNNYKSYFLRILNVRTGVSIMNDNDLQVEITKMQNKSHAFRLQECINRFAKTRLKKKSEMIHFLFRASQLGKDYTNQTIDTLFKSQEVSQVNMSQTIPRKIVEEIHNNTNYVNEQTLSLIKQIADKGNQSISINENDLIRDLIFSIQGIDGQYIQYDPVVQSFCVKKEIALSLPSRKLINVMCECGWLFKQVQLFQQQNNPSLVVQALQNSLKEELNEYYRLIAYFENLQTEGTLTLRKMYMWLKQPMHYLTQIDQLISIIETNTNQGTTSALIISSLVRFSKHGCPITSQLFSRLLNHTTIPLTRFINQWIFDGTIDDLAQEFFVERNENRNQIKDCGELWKYEFRVNQDKLPSVINQHDAYKIFDTGRVINWLRKQCKLQKFHLDLDLMTVDMLGTEQFTQWVNNANEKNNKELISLIMPNFKVTLQAIKRFLLLGQGEFIHTLMELLQNELSKPAKQVYRHSLLSLLESAFKNIQQEVRLNVKLLEPSQNDTGWEIFCLDYVIDEPLNTIFNGKMMLQYYRIFNLLWSIKRVEYTLSQCWKMHQKFIRIPNQFQQLKKTLQLSYSMMNEMQHFIKNLYSYIMLEAVESPWKKFIDECEKVKDLDNLIKLHENFIQEVSERSFLTTKGEQTQRLLLKLFDHIFRLQSSQELLLSYAKDIITSVDDQSLQLKNLLNRQQQSQNQIKLRTQEIVKSLLELRKSYRDQMFELQERLKRDDRLKFLHFKLDFNEYYLGICESKLFNVDLERFIGMCLPKTTNNDINQQKIQSTKQLIPQQQQIQPKHKSQIIPQNEFQEQVKSVKEGLKLLEEQRRQHLQLKEQLSKSPHQKSPLIQITPTLTEHEKRKNDEDLDSSDDENN